MSSAWGLAAVDLRFVSERIVPYVFRADDRDKTALLNGLDVEAAARRLAVLDALDKRRPPEVVGDDYAHPRRTAWQDAAAFGGELGRPFLLLGRTGTNDRIDQYLASDAATCLQVLAAQFSSEFPEWARDAGPPQTWPDTPWHHGPQYPSPLTAGLDLVRDLWLARQRGEETAVLPMNQVVEEGEEPRKDDIVDFLDAHTLAIMVGYAVAHQPTIWAGSGWVNLVGMFEHVQMASPHLHSPRAVFGPVLPAGVMKTEGERYYNNGRLTDDTWGVLGAVILPENVEEVRRQLAEVGRLLKDPATSFAAAERHLGGRAELGSLIGSLFGKAKPVTVPRDEITRWAEGFAAESEFTLAFFDEALSYAQSHGLAIPCMLWMQAAASAVGRPELVT